MATQNTSIEAAATTINWIGYWGGESDFEGPLRGDALSWSGEQVRHFVQSGGRDLPAEEHIDTEDSFTPHTGAGAAWNVAETSTPWWVEAQFHTEGPPDDESIPRKLEGWWQIHDFSKDEHCEIGDELKPGELCFVEKLWSDRIRIFKPGPSGPFGIVELKRVCDLQLMKKKGAPVGCSWDLLRDIGEGGDDPDDIRVGQRRVLLGGEYGTLKLRGMECEVVNYVEWMDRWTVEIPVKDNKGKNHCIAVVPAQLKEPKLPRDPKPNGKVCLDMSLKQKAMELYFRSVAVRDEDPSARPGATEVNASQNQSNSGAPAEEAGEDDTKGKDGQDAYKLAGAMLRAMASGEKMPSSRALALRPKPKKKATSFGGEYDGHFRLRMRFVSRVRPGGRVWTACEESMYKYVEVRYIGQGDYGVVFRVLRMVDNSKKVLDDDEEDPHVVLDVPRGSDKGAITKAYRKLARQWHPDKVPEDQRDHAVLEFRRIHQAYENLLADPEKSSDLMILKMQHPAPPRSSKRISVPSSFATEVRCLTLITNLRVPNVAKLVEVGPENHFVVTWPYIAECLMPCNESDGVNQVDRVDLVRQGWSDYSRSRRTAQQMIRTMMALIRHDVMMVDPIQNIVIERESGEPLFIDFGRGETAGSIYTTRIKTFMKKVLSLLVRSVAKTSYDVAAKFIRDIENTLFEELETWQDEKTRDQKKAVAIVNTTTKWQEGIDCCREIWGSQDENPFRKMFKGQNGVLPDSDRKLRAPKDPDEMPDRQDSDEDVPQEPQEEEEEDDPEGLCDADINTLTPVQKLLRAKRAKGRRAKLPNEKPSLKIKMEETLPDGKLGLGLDDADENQRGVVIIHIDKRIQKFGFELMDRIIEVNGKFVDDWDEFRQALEMAKQYSSSVIFGIVREGVARPQEPKVPQCLHCGSRGKHLQKCTTWRPLPEGEQWVWFCDRNCQKEAWKSAKKSAAPAA